MSAYRVAEATQVLHTTTVDEETVSTLYTEGETVPLDAEKDAELIAYWLNAGWIEEAQDTRAAKKARRS